MKSLIHEIHRRSLWQVLGLYAAGGWLVLQVVATFVELWVGADEELQPRVRAAQARVEQFVAERG